MKNEILKKEDYEEPSCPFCTDMFKNEPVVKSVPISRIIEKLDSYLNKNDYSSAERHLYYWLQEAEIGNDKRGALAIYNELLGLTRKTNQKEKAFNAVENTLKLLKELEFNDNITAGTTYVNIATVLKSFDKNYEALEYYKKAEAIYNACLSPSDSRMGGLFNNMALALTDTNSFDGAEKYYKKAISIMEKAENGELEVAITYLNMANLAKAKDGLEESEEIITQYIDKAVSLLDSPHLPRDGYYAFVCEKCAPTFGYYGYFMIENDLKKRADEIYERN